MSIIHNNPLVEGASGALGRTVVYKRWRGRTVMANMPSMPETRSEKQVQHNDCFKAATQYAKRQTAKPDMKALYEKGIDDRKFSAYSVALADWMNPPTVTDITAESYRGEPGELIRIRASDDFMVASVSVTITDGDQRIVEKGEAIKRGKRDLWRLTTTVRNKSVPGTVITVVAMDLASNTATATLTIPGDATGPIFEIVPEVVVRLSEQKVVRASEIKSKAGAGGADVAATALPKDD